MVYAAEVCGCGVRMKKGTMKYRVRPYLEIFRGLSTFHLQDGRPTPAL